MRFEALEYFVAVAESGSLTAASRGLFVSQQGLSKAMAALERDLGCRLFEREGARLRLTGAGHALLPHARRCLAERDELLGALAPFTRASAPGRVAAERAGCPTLHACAFVTDSLFSLLDRDLAAAGLDDVTIIEHSYAEIKDALERGGEGAVYALCLPIAEAEELRRLPGLTFRPLFVTEMMLAASSQFIRPGKGAFPLARVAELPVAYYNDAVLNDIIRDMFREHPLRNVVTHASNPTRIANSVSMGKAVTFSDSLSVFLAEPNRAIAHAPIEGAARFCMGFAYANDASPDATALDYVSRFEECFRARCAAYLADPAHRPIS